MTTEQIIRDQLDRATHDVVGGPDLATSIRDGRRRRRTTRAGAAAAAVAALVLGGVVTHALAGDGDGDGDRSVAHDAPVADGAAQAAPAGPVDFVPGTDVDESMAVVIAELLPSLPAPDDVYPSDSKTAGPIPDAEFANAQDWQATYTTETGGALVMMGIARGDRRLALQRLRRARGPRRHPVPRDLQHDDGGTWSFGTYFVGDDGHFVNAFESVQAPDGQTAADQRQLSDADLEALVADPRLTF